MGVKILIHIRHIRGHSFDVEVDRDADCIGLKVAVWDLQKIAVDSQRLVYDGKEIPDETHLVTLGIDDGSTIFLVEKVQNVPVVVAPVEPHVIAVPEESVSVSAGIEPMSVNSQYQQLPVDTVSEERIQSTIDLAFWVRMYCVFGVVVSIGAAFRCWGPAIPLICLIIGYFACRKLNRCCLVFPLLVSIAIGPVGFVFCLWRLANHFKPILLLALFVSFLHILIMASILKLRCRIKHLTPEEKRTAVERIRARSRCCRR
jgi:hypothetical protein